MQSVIAELEQGSEWDSRLLFFGVLFIISAFISTYETELWKASDKLLLPLLITGVSLVILNIFLRAIRPKLKITLIETKGELLQIYPVKNLQFSGWVVLEPILIEVSKLLKVKVHNFYTPATGSGMYWVCLEFSNKQVIEYNFNNYKLVKDLINYFNRNLPQVTLDVDERIKT